MLQSPWVLDVLGGPCQGRSFSLPQNYTVVMGRAEDALIFLPHDAQLSPKHCTLTHEGQQVWLTDLHSQTGTFVYGLDIAPIGTVPLAEGETFTAGSSTFRLRRQPPDILSYLRNQPAPLLALLDASRDPRILEWLNTSGERYQSLFEGMKAQWLAEFAPYLVQLPKTSVLLEPLVREGWGKHWGVYLTSLTSFEEVLGHVRQFLWVQTEEGKKLYFRFYDPRVLRVFVPTLTPQEEETFFGPIKQWFMEDETFRSVLEWSHLSRPHSRPQRLESPPTFIVHQTHLTAFSQAARDQFISRMMEHLRETFPNQTAELEDHALHTRIVEGIFKAASYEIYRECDVECYLNLMFALSFDFDTHPDTSWADRILNRKGLRPEMKIFLLYDRYETEYQTYADSKK